MSERYLNQENGGTNWIKDGGSAFPCEGGHDSGLLSDPGMSLRDWFAGQALAAMGTWVPGYSDFSGLDKDVDRRAAYAYRMADAILEAREE